MLRSLKEILGYTLQETDDVLGQCKDFFFDDGLWVIRYMLADTGGWLSHHKVLITPNSLGEPDWQTERLPVKLNRQQIEDCPPLESHLPISREYEVNYHEHFKLPFYWMGADFREGMPDSNGSVAPVDDLPIDDTDNARENTEQRDVNTDELEGKLRSAVEVMDYLVYAKDGEMGRVDDIIIEDDTWVIRYLVIDTGQIITGKKVLINTEWIDSVNWTDTHVYIDLTKEAIENCPDYDSNDPINREYEVRLYDYHGRPRYWEQK